MLGSFIWFAIGVGILIIVNLLLSIGDRSRTKTAFDRVIVYTYVPLLAFMGIQFIVGSFRGYIGFIDDLFSNRPYVVWSARVIFIWLSISAVILTVVICDKVSKLEKYSKGVRQVIIGTVITTFSALVIFLITVSVGEFIAPLFGD